ncbi:MAG: hypothetical protein IIV82_05455 [Ruminococcus sp.]|nr:hypothetical protein [Ruminococcus sp.]
MASQRKISDLSVRVLVTQDFEASGRTALCFCVEFVEIKFKGRVFARPFQFLSVVIDKADGVGSSVTLHPIRRSVTLHPIRLLKRFSDRKRSATAVSSQC